MQTGKLTRKLVTAVEFCPGTDQVAGTFTFPGGVMPSSVTITRAHGLITRDQAAKLSGVTPDCVTLWSTRGYLVTLGDKTERHFLPVADRENGRPLYYPVEVQKAEYHTRKRARRVVGVAA